jgi:hypothetical protein
MKKELIEIIFILLRVKESQFLTNLKYKSTLEDEAHTEL